MVELLVVAALVGLLTTALPILIRNFATFGRLSLTRISLQAQARTLEELLRNRIQNASQSTVIIDQLGPLSETAEGAGPEGPSNPPYSRIRFQMATSTSSATDNWTWIWQEGSKLYIGTTDPNPAPPHFPVLAPINAGIFARNLESLSFSYDAMNDGSALRFSFALRESIHQKNRRYQSQSVRLELRN